MIVSRWEHHLVRLWTPEFGRPADGRMPRSQTLDFSAQIRLLCAASDGSTKSHRWTSGGLVRVTVKLPRLSDAGDDAAVVAWEALVGAVLQVGDALVSVETAKAQVSVPTPVAGVLVEQLVDVDDEIEVGAAIAVLEVTP